MEREMEGVEQIHILPGGSRQDTTLAVPVPGLEEEAEGAEQTHILPGGRRQDTTLAVPVPGLEKDDLINISKEIVRELETRWATRKPGIEEVLGKVMGWTDAHTDLRIHLLG
jgi:hypothetical protein